VSKLTDEQMTLWEETLTEMIRVLDWTADDAERIRKDLQRIQKDITSTRASIESMVASANQ